ncbi:RibD family protein [Ghiorsea bivora]|uniref:RibD family protein n=1 Tax=Ghiorsea bivora TaxID=1485545 RepID=UPI000571685B|nr:dihydrofolate reductase family protein [Ghiorsea bivora]
MLKQLYPQCDVTRLLEGAYLDLNLHQQAKAGDVYIYVNYISSLDGRIALYNEQLAEYEVPPAIANGRDWRLYQELAGQADVMLTSARYFRQLAKGKAQDLLPVGEGEAYADIKHWREKQGLKPQPDVMVLSDSLDIPLEALEKVKDRKVIVCTSSSDVEKITQLEQAGVLVLPVMSSDKVNSVAREYPLGEVETSRDPLGAKPTCGASFGVTGKFMRQCLLDLNYRSAYLIAGPKVHATFIKDACVNELFLTTHFTLLGGEKASGLVDADLSKAQSLKLISLYLDTAQNQLFQRFQYV